MQATLNPDVFIQSALIGFDTETRDPHLSDKGPGCYRGDGYTVGVSFAAEGVAEYYPLRHPDTTAEEREGNLRKINAILQSKNKKVGANVMYDLDWMHAQPAFTAVCGEVHDIQLAEPLLDEYRPSYSLASLADIYGFEPKAVAYLKKKAAELGFKGNPNAAIHKMPGSVVAHYAKLDAHLPLAIFNAQLGQLSGEGLFELYNMERKLIPLLLQMRNQGVRLDVPLFKHAALRASEHQVTLQKEIWTLAKKEFDINSTLQLSKVLDGLGVRYPRRPPTKLMALAGKAGHPSLDKDALTNITHPIAGLVLAYRHYTTLINMFFVSYASLQVNGRLHCSFHPLKSDEYGTVSGRFSSSKPNLQQVPAMDDDTAKDDALRGKLVRKLFLPEPDHTWAKLDYSQIEYRVIAHYALGPGAEELRKAYNDNPNTDYHQRIQDSTGFSRREAKRLNFGGSYGMGAETASKKFGWTKEEAELFMSAYHRAAPYLKYTRQRVIQRAEERGYIYTLLGRRARVHPSRSMSSFFNRLIQGSAADIMKASMVKAYEAGVFNVLKPHLTVHDELDVSVPPTKAGKEALAELKIIMETALQLSVPLIVDCHEAANWAEAD